MSLDPAYQSRLMELYAWQKDFIFANESPGITTPATSEYVSVYDLANATDWYYRTRHFTDAAARDVFGARWLGTVDDDPLIASEIQLSTAYPAAAVGDFAGVRYGAASNGASGGTDVNDIRLCNDVTAMLANCLAQVWSDVGGLAAWDALFATAQSEVEANSSTVPNPEYLSGFTAGCNVVLATAGIVPGKSDTANGSTGCWQDVSDAQYWWMLSDGYAPAFTGVEYYSTQAGSFINTQEFAFMIRCACPERFQVGNTLTIQIGASLASTEWGTNENLQITTIPTTPLYLAGGKNADTSETWAVAAKDSGNTALPQFVADDLNRGYASGGLAFTLAAGGIPYNVGDRFTFTVEGGTFKWRKNAGSWSASTAIADDTALDSGLLVSFLAGSAPSFVTGDSYNFRANQPAAATGLLTPNAAKWQWEASTATITFTLTAGSTFDNLSLLHDLPTGTAIAVDYWDADAVPDPAFKPLAWASGVLRSYLHVTTGTAVTTTIIRIAVDHPGSIRWLWAGRALQPQYSAGLRIRKQFDVARAKQAGSASLLGQGEGATLVWDVLTPDDADDLIDLVYHIKTNGDEPCILIPQHLHPQEAIICRLAEDGIELTDIFEYQPDDTSKRILSGSMEMTPEWR